jgi:hypothetical protein
MPRNGEKEMTMPEPITPEVTDPETPSVTPVDPETPPVDPEETDPEGADALGEPGKRALDSMKSKWAAEKAKAKALQEQLDALNAKPADEKTPEDYQREADARATAKANERVLKADLRLAAKDILIDPSDAFLNLDLSQFEADADGEFDPEEIADALKDLVKRKPHLGKTAAQGGKRVPMVAADPVDKPSNPPSLDEQIAAAVKAGNHAKAISLKRQKAYTN